MRRTSIASSLLVLSVVAAGCGAAQRHGPVVTKETLRALAQLRHAKSPQFYLGTTYGRLPLIHVESEQGLPSSLWYGDCTWLELNSMSPACRSVVSIENDQPAPGEIDTQGRCTYSATIRGATVAFFPVNPLSLRVFMPDATLYVSARTKGESLAAAHALRALNRSIDQQMRLPHRDVARQLGTCRPLPKRHVVVVKTPKARYEMRMKRAVFVEALSGLNVAAVGNTSRAVRQSLRDTANLPPLLRNMADRIDGITPLQAVTDLHHGLVEGMRGYAADIDHARTEIRNGAWRDHRVLLALEGRLQEDAAALQRIIRGFQQRGYSIYIKPTD